MVERKSNTVTGIHEPEPIGPRTDWCDPVCRTKWFVDPCTETQDEGIARVISKLPLFELRTVGADLDGLWTAQGVVNMTCSCFLWTILKSLKSLEINSHVKKCSKTDILLNRHFSKY